MDKFWRSHFDRVVVIRHTAYVAHGRGLELEDELRRCGLFGVADFRWTFPSPFVWRLARLLRLAPDVRCMGNVDAAVFGFYSEMKISLALGAERLLVLEDDVRFASDLDLVRSSVDSMPDGFLEAHLAWLLNGGGATPADVLAAPRVAGAWVPVLNRVRVRDTSAVAYSREGMEHLVELYESSQDIGKPGLSCCDVTDLPYMLLDEGRRNYLAVPLVARQVITSSRMCRRTTFDQEYRPFCAGGDPKAFGGTHEH